MKGEGMDSLLAKLFSLFQGVDSTFSLIVVSSVVLFLAGELLWWLFASKKAIPGLPRDDVRLKFVWTVAPALVLALLLFVHSPRLQKRIASFAPAAKAASAPAPKVPRQDGV
jgi:hypothetical protein